jgi:CDP-6-deoxy-D-xylo-4-hexulose-3-dehydrase
MNQKYHLAEDTITREDLNALADWLKSDPPPRLTMGPLVKQYEEKWSNWLGRKYSVSCNSGSSANLLMYYALLRSGRLKNKKVIVPSAAWVTTIAPAIQLGFEPIMCDADYNTWALNLRHLRQLLKEHNPGTVVLVQVLGVPHHINNLMELKRRYGFFLLEDACAAMGSSYHNQKVGTFGDMASMSSYYGHQFSTVEGGLVSTDDKDLYNMLLMLRSHGWVAHLDPETKVELLKKYEIEDIGTNFVFCEPGFNFRMTDLQAFIGLRQLDRMDWLVEKRFENHCLYKQLLDDWFMTQLYDNMTTVCSIHFCALASNDKERNTIVKVLEESGIETRPFTSGNQGLQPYWFREYGKFSTPTADILYHCGFFLPNHPYLQKEDIEYICSVTIKAAQDFRKGGK